MELFTLGVGRVGGDGVIAKGGDTSRIVVEIRRNVLIAFQSYMNLYNLK